MAFKGFFLDFVTLQPQHNRLKQSRRKNNNKAAKDLLLCRIMTLNVQPELH